MPVPDLKECCQLCIIHHIIGDGCQNNLYQRQQQFLLSQLDEGAWGAESLDIFNRAVRHHGYFISPQVILALVPNTTKELSLKECPGLNEECLNTILDRCDCLQTLDITENPLLQLSSIHLFSTNNEYMYISLTTVILEDCSQAKDSHIQTLIRKAPLLQHLNIARCDITDRVFLLNEQKQLAREACLEIKGLTSIFDCHLETVDVSRCLEFTSTGVRHLCTLCGPTLRSVNMAWTKVDCTAFLYLSGLGLPSAVEFFMARGAMSIEMMEPLVYNLHQFNITCQDIAAKWRDDEDQLAEKKSDGDGQRDVTPDGSGEQDGVICLDEIHPYFTISTSNQNNTSQTENTNATSSMPYHSSDDKNKNMDSSSDEVSNSHKEESVTNEILFSGAPSFQIICLDDLLQSSHSFDKNKMPEKHCNNSHNPPCEISDSHADRPNCECIVSTQEGESSGKNYIVHSHQDTLEDSLKLSECKSETVDHFDEAKNSSRTDFEESNSLSVKCFENEENYKPVDDSQTDFGSSCYAMSSECENTNNRHKISGASDNDFFFTSHIHTISLTAIVFREETLGLRCFQKFLTTNQDLRSVTIYSGISGNFLSDNVLDLICTYCRGLESLCVEGSDKLTSDGILEIADKCKHLTSVDLTGVSFVGDEGIIPLVKALPLTHLKLAETRVTEMFMNKMATLPLAQKLQELDLSWCEEIAGVEGVNNVISSCPQMGKLMLRECCISNTTLACIAQRPHCITELSLASNMSVMRDEDVILLCEHLPLLTFIDLGWNSYLTNPSIEALLSNCHYLERANLEGLKLITSSPFLPLVSVPEEISVHLEKKAENQDDSEGKSECKVKLTDLPCLPHRSTTYSTHIRHVNLTYSDFVEDDLLQQIVTITHGGVEMLDYYGNKVEPSKASLEKFLWDYMESRGKHG